MVKIQRKSAPKKVSKQVRKPKKQVLAKSLRKQKLKKIPKPVIQQQEAISEDEPLSEEPVDTEDELSEVEAENGNTSENSDGEDEVQSGDEAKKHKQDLDKLKKSDPEFYKFLLENDKKLLQFNLSDEEDVEEPEEKLEKVHKLSRNLEVASDESDYEAEDETTPKDERNITLKMIKTWQLEIKVDKTNRTIQAVTQAFHAALCRISGDDSNLEPSQYKVEGAAVFNGIIQLCVLELGPAIRKFLGLHQGSKQSPHTCKKFVKIKKTLKMYFMDILKLLLGVTSTSIHTVLLKHLHYLANMLVSFPNITKSLVKQLVQLWGTGDDSVRVLAFFCILRITNNQRATILDVVLKSMYMTYVKNSKFVNLKNLSSINFMRRSLVEMFALDANVSYQHVFLYIRQLAIHLRNAITLNKMENVQAVYNWQFVNSLKLWQNLLTVTYNKPIMQQLIYPFVQVCMGTIKLVPTAQYYPLRFQIVQILMDLEKGTGVFVPVMPFLLEILTSYDFNKKHQKVSMKPMHFTCLLRLSKSQLIENGFKDAVIEAIYGLLLEYLSTNSHLLVFPDLTLLCTQQIKLFLKRCRNINYTRKFKQLIDKIEQNSKFVEKERTKVTVTIADQKKIEGFEAQLKQKGTPLTAFYDNWNKLRIVKKNKLLTNNEELGDYKLPVINKTKRNVEKSDGPVELFPSDSEDEVEEEKKPRRGKRGGKKFKTNVEVADEPVQDDGEKDIVNDINADDW